MYALRLTQNGCTMILEGKAKVSDIEPSEHSVAFMLHADGMEISTNNGRVKVTFLYKGEPIFDMASRSINVGDTLTLTGIDIGVQETVDLRRY